MCSTFSITRLRGCSGTNSPAAVSTRSMTPIFNRTRTRLTPSGADRFSFQTGYSPDATWTRYDHDDLTNEDRQFLDFRARRLLLGLQLGAVLPRPALHRPASQPEPSVRGRAGLVPLHLQSDAPGTAFQLAAALLDSQAPPRSHRAQQILDQQINKLLAPSTRRLRPRQHEVKELAQGSLQPLPARRSAACRPT